MPRSYISILFDGSLLAEMTKLNEQEQNSLEKVKFLKSGFQEDLLSDWVCEPETILEGVERE